MKNSFEEYRQKYDELKKTYQQNEGRLHALMEELQEEFKVTSLEEAVTLLQSLEDKAEAASEKMRKLLVKIQSGIDAIEEALDGNR